MCGQQKSALGEVIGKFFSLVRARSIFRCLWPCRGSGPECGSGYTGWKKRKRNGKVQKQIRNAVRDERVSPIYSALVCRFVPGLFSKLLKLTKQRPNERRIHFDDTNTHTHTANWRWCCKRTQLETRTLSFTKLSQIFTLCAETFPTQIKHNAPNGSCSHGQILNSFLQSPRLRQNGTDRQIGGSRSSCNVIQRASTTPATTIKIKICETDSGFTIVIISIRRIFCIHAHDIPRQMGAKIHASGPWHIDFRLHFLVVDYVCFIRCPLLMTIQSDFVSHVILYAARALVFVPFNWSTVDTIYYEKSRYKSNPIVSNVLRTTREHCSSRCSRARERKTEWKNCHFGCHRGASFEFTWRLRTSHA